MAKPHHEQNLVLIDAVKRASWPNRKEYARNDWDSLGLKPINGQYHSRHGVHQVSITANYKCLDPYGPTQRVQFLGIIITVHHPKDSRIQDSVVCRPGATAEKIMRQVQDLLSRVMKKCTHSRSKYVRHTGNCMKEHECLDCGELFGIDSSD